MIRAAKHTDIDAIINMAEVFWMHTVYDDPFCQETVEGMAESCIDNDFAAVLEIDGKTEGFACAIKGPLLANNDVQVGIEVAWWVNEEHRGGRNGIKLLMFMEDLARQAGVKHWNMVYMVSSMPDQIEKMYQKLGYRKTEVTYSKVL